MIKKEKLMIIIIKQKKQEKMKKVKKQIQNLKIKEKRNYMMKKEDI